MSSGRLALSIVLLQEFQMQPQAAMCPPFELEERRKAIEDLWRPKLAAQKPANESSLQFARRLEDKVEEELVREIYAYFHRMGVKRSAICFSGGGIRSATFALGLVQGLAQKKLLRHFDFLSTVSGGGYLGSWLSAWLLEKRKEEKCSAEEALFRVEEEICAQPLSPLDPEPEPIRHLRRHSRYMSPQLGVLSVDTWTLAATYLRNLLLNWLVFLPLIAALLMLPRLSILLVEFAEETVFKAHKTLFIGTAYFAAIVFGAVAIGYVAPARPSLIGESRMPPRLQSQKAYLWLYQGALFLMAVCLATLWAWIKVGGLEESLQLAPGLPMMSFFRYWSKGLPTFLMLGLLMHLAGWGVSRYWVRKLELKELVAVFVSGLFGGFLLWCATLVWFNVELGQPAQLALYVCGATPLILMVYLLASFLFVALANSYTTDADREWMARSAGWTLVTLIVRALLAFIVFFGPAYFLEITFKGDLFDSIFTSVLGGVSGLLTLLLGLSARTGLFWGRGANQEKKSDSPHRIYDILLGLAAPVFSLFLLILISLGTTLLIREVASWMQGGPPLGQESLKSASDLLRSTVKAPRDAVLVVFFFLWLLVLVMGRVIDINLFSLHSTYRDRLIRAYLGASRRSESRNPHPFTGFDDDDNPHMFELQGNRPLHVLNMALNLVGSSQVGGQDRKASSFTVSALHAGSSLLGFRRAEVYASAVSKYWQQKKRSGGITLGTAMAISGAAASPNMGYHSSPVITFLLAMFNVRLGWWLGNPGPAGESTHADTSPDIAAGPLLREAFGLTTESYAYVYLSDGGHFENLGLYEMVLRRCHFIVVSDAGHDPGLGFEDLGNALTKIRIDLGIRITFEELPMRPRKGENEFFGASSAGKEIRRAFALGRIHYQDVDGKEAETGYLLYIKPSLDGGEPVNVYQYAKENPSFPHEPTADQLFSEAQFESYRALGEYIMGKMLQGFEDATLAELFGRLGDGSESKRKLRAKGKSRAFEQRLEEAGRSDGPAG